MIRKVPIEDLPKAVSPARLADSTERFLRQYPVVGACGRRYLSLESLTRYMGSRGGDASYAVVNRQRIELVRDKAGAWSWDESDEAYALLCDPLSGYDGT